MPQPGETITEGTVVRWLAKAGDAIKEKQPLVELETEKALFEYESPYAGTLQKIVAGDGKVVPVGESLAIFTVADEKAHMYSMLGLGQATGAGKTSTLPIKKEPPKANGHPIHGGKLSPLVRRLMQENDISMEELGDLVGTGLGGRITKEDISQVLLSRTVTKSTDKDEELVPCSPIRMRIAENMVKSKQTIPHAHVHCTVDVTALVEHRRRKAVTGNKVAYLSLIFPFLKEAILETPLVNASYRKDNNAIAVYKKINLGVAVDTPKGLMIPVLSHAEQLSPDEFNNKLGLLVQRAQKNQLTVQDLTGVTFTFNNFGYFGTEIGVQIILPPQSTTLGMGRMEKRPWVVGDDIKIRWVSDFTLAFDHRVMDGRDAGKFLEHLKRSLESFHGQGTY